jgi:release factor glutamine methyltransferase
VVTRLRAAGCVAAEEEAERYLAAAPDANTLDSWLCRRELGEPVAWITGTTVFCGRSVFVEHDVFVPRTHTEGLAQRAARLLPHHGAALDLCTGAGAVAAHLRAEHPAASVVGVDVDARAARCARRNGVPALVGDLGAPVRGAAFDVVTAVPPYVPAEELRFLPDDVRRHEPARALDGGPGGLDVAIRVVEAASRLLHRGGWLLVEIGGDQDQPLDAHLTRRGFRSVETWNDHDGDLRGVMARSEV